MTLNDSKLCKNATLYLGAAYILSFIIYYLPTFVISSEILTYISVFIRKGSYLLLPMISALMTFIFAEFIGLKAALIRLIPLTAVRILYLLPSLYLMLLYEGFDSLEGVGYGLLLSLGEAALVYGITLLVFLLMRAIARYRTGTELKADFSEKDRFNFASGVTLSIFSVSLIAFVYFFVEEIINTVSYLIESAGRYYANEIIYMCVSFIYDIALLFIFHFTLFYIKDFVLSKRLDKNTLA